MKVELVNGFVCRDCADVALAKRGLDPVKPRPENMPPGDDAREGANRLLAEGGRGTRVNLMA